MNKSRHVTFRCTQEEYDLIKKYSGTNVSKWIVGRLFYSMRRLDFDGENLDQPFPRIKDEHIIMDEYEVKDNGELKHIRRKTTPLKDKS